MASSAPLHTRGLQQQKYRPVRRKTVMNHYCVACACLRRAKMSMDVVQNSRVQVDQTSHSLQILTPAVLHGRRARHRNCTCSPCTSAYILVKRLQRPHSLQDASSPPLYVYSQTMEGHQRRKGEKRPAKARSHHQTILIIRTTPAGGAKAEGENGIGLAVAIDRALSALNVLCYILYVAVGRSHFTGVAAR